MSNPASAPHSEEKVTQELDHLTKYFESLEGCQEQLEANILTDTPLPDGLIAEPISISVDVTPNHISSKALQSRLAQLPPELKATTNIFTQDHLQVLFKDQPAEEEDIPLPPVHYDENNSLPTHLTNSQRNNKPTEPEQSDEQPPSLTSQNYLLKELDHNGTGKRICGLLFASEANKEIPASITGVRPDARVSTIQSSLFVRVISSTFDSTPCDDLEPVYFVLSIFQFSPHRKLTEDVHIDVNSPKLLSMSGDLHEGSHPFTESNAAVFPLDPTLTGEAFLVFRISKTLNQLKQRGAEHYLMSSKAAETMRTGAKEKKKLEELKAEYSENCQNLAQHQQVFAYGFVPIILSNQWQNPPGVTNWNEDEMRDVELNDIYLAEKDLDEFEMTKQLDYIRSKKDSGTKIPGTIKLQMMKMERTRPEIEISVQMEEEGERKEDVENGIVVHPLLKDKPVRRVQSFLPPPLPLSSSAFYHFLYLSPLSLDLSKHKESHQNLAICIRVLDSDYTLSDPNENRPDVGLPIIFAKSHQKVLVSEIWTTSTYHHETPHFPDEIKIALPFRISERLHILFDFYHISCQAYKDRKKGAKKGREAQRYLGSSVLPLTSLEQVCKEGPRQLKIVSKIDKESYLKFFQDDKDTNLKYYLNGEPKFTILTRLISTIVPLDEGTRELVTSFNRPMIRQFTLKPKTNDMFSGIDVNADQTLTLLKDRSASIFFPTIADTTFSRICKEPDVERKKRLFELIELFDLTQSTIFQSDTDKIQYDVLVDYIEKKYRFWNTRVSEETRTVEVNGEKKKIKVQIGEGEAIHDILLRVMLEIVMELSYKQIINFIMKTLNIAKKPAKVEQTVVSKGRGGKMDAQAQQAQLEEKEQKEKEFRVGVVLEVIRIIELHRKRVSANPPPLSLAHATLTSTQLSIINSFSPLLVSWAEAVNISVSSNPDDNLVSEMIIDEILYSKVAEPGNQTLFAQFMRYQKIFLCFILKSMVLSCHMREQEKLGKEDEPVQNTSYSLLEKSSRKARFTPSFYTLLKALTILTSVCTVSGGSNIASTTWVTNLAQSLTQFWTICDRGQINEIILAFVVHFRPLCAKGTKKEDETGKAVAGGSEIAPVQSNEQINKILQTRLDFWDVLTRSSHWLTVAWFSGECGGIVRKKKPVTVVEIEDKPKEGENVEGEEQTEKKTDAKEQEEDFAITHTTPSYFLPHLLILSIFDCQSRAFLTASSKPVTSAAPPKQKKTKSLADDLDDESDDDEAMLVDTTNEVFTVTEEKPVKPFQFLQQLFSRFDKRKLYTSSSARASISRLHFFFVANCVERIEDLLVPALQNDEKLNCFSSCVWLLSNAQDYLIRTFVSALVTTSQADKLIIFLSSIYEHFQPSNVKQLMFCEYQKSQQDFESQLKSKKLEIEQMQAKQMQNKGKTIAEKRAELTKYRKEKREEEQERVKRNVQTLKLSSSFARASQDLTGFSLNDMKSNTIIESPTSSFSSLRNVSDSHGTTKRARPDVSTLFRSPSTPDVEDEDEKPVSPAISRTESTNSMESATTPRETPNLSTPTPQTPITTATPTFSSPLSRSIQSQDGTFSLQIDMNNKDQLTELEREMAHLSQVYKDKASLVAYSMASKTILYTTMTLVAVMEKKECWRDSAEKGEPTQPSNDDVVFLGDVSPFSFLMNFFNNHPSYFESRRFKHLTTSLFKKAEQDSSIFIAAPHSTLQHLQDIVLRFIHHLIFQRKQSSADHVASQSFVPQRQHPLSLEATRVVFSLFHFFFPLITHTLFIRSQRRHYYLIQFLLTHIFAQSADIREEAARLVYYLFTLNEKMCTDQVRMRLWITQFLVEKENEWDEDHGIRFDEFVARLRELLSEDASTKEEGIETDFASHLNYTLDILSGISSSFTRNCNPPYDPDLAADRNYDLTLAFSLAPEFRLQHYSALESETPSSDVDEIALIQVSKLAIILDILSQFWRNSPLKVDVTFPQLLPIRSDFSHIQNGKLDLIPLESMLLKSNADDDEGGLSGGVPPPPPPPIQYKRRYGTGWCAWDTIIRIMLPQFKLYTPHQLHLFTTHPDFKQVITDTKLFTIENAIAQCGKAADLLCQAELYEYALEIRRIHLSLVQAVNDGSGLAEVFNRLASDETAVMTKAVLARLKCSYYRVGLYGHDFGKEHGTQFISKEYNWMKLGEFKFKLIDKYKKRFGKDIVIVTDDTIPTFTDEQLETPHVQLASVKPQFVGWEEEDRPTDWSLKTNLQRFTLEKPFTKEPIKKPQMHESWLRKVTFECEHSLPFVVRRTRVRPSGMTVVEITPAMFSVRDIISKTEDIRKATDPLDAKGIQPLVSGAIAPQVNEGVMSVYRCFLHDHKDTTSEDDQEELKAAFHEFFAVCRVALCRMSKLTLTPGFLDALVEKYNSLLDEVEAELGKLKKIEKGEDY
ncbi:putative Dedicator of cytokinesis protein 7 [Blattamonas nauphoetae]|uniref:Dedicator of cytokinesis protein 7 n=1 Tax=Blattamonas nauphoetae TaxID=2049346 RepID=A0ABQ9Y2W4_9EUKA|nr:putative Dedicator of cytokinesis protein 7 [Blattamonas nauphoetae]